MGPGDPHPPSHRAAVDPGFRQWGMLGLLPDEVEVVRGRTKRISEAIRQALDRLKALYDGFDYRELACILFLQCGSPLKTVKALWQESPVSGQGHLGLWHYHVHPDRYQARLQVIKLYSQG
jgi:hypothetical protein